ncbi:phospholipase D-like domain-containing protein [Spongiimicrobium salis]|uniref:phospholipase D-like domain-containing protein n=1 Tax=Spongiimicrobium salis TaxID=1667022 RepID=UPI00374D70C8
MSNREQILINPITEEVRKSTVKSVKHLLFAVPFISGFAKKIIDGDTINQVKDKRIITRFNDSNINTFNIPALSYLLDCGFKILINNNVHLKLYITDNDTYVTSSNLTQGGFVKNDELTIRVAQENESRCKSIFNDLWANQDEGFVNKQTIKDSWDKYNSLKKQDDFSRLKKPKTTTKSLEELSLNKLDTIALFKTIATTREVYEWTLEREIEANRKRNIVKKQLKENGFDLELFYVPKEHHKRNETLFYDFVYGIESKLAGTGLWEKAFKTSFEHPNFKEVVGFVYPESVGLPAWNLKNEEELMRFCKGLFSFNISHFSSALPIRIASYFHPEIFFPIFNLGHLRTTFGALQNKTNAKDNWELLFVYTNTFTRLLKDISISLYAKSSILYQLHYAVELHRLIDEGVRFEDAVKSFGEKWKQNYGRQAVKYLKQINAID